MPDFKPLRQDCFKEAVCINAGRVYDACRDRECLEDLPVYFTEQDQEIINNAVGIKLKMADVINVLIDTEPVPFNRGYYCTDLTIYIAVYLDVTVSPLSAPSEVCGLCIYNKKAILYGSEGNVKQFSSDYAEREDDMQNLPGANLPKVTCRIADPVTLGCKLGRECCTRLPTAALPGSVARRFGGSFCCCKTEKSVTCTIGLFMMIQLERQVQMLIPVYDFCMPEKVCVDECGDDPCELFGKISFPTEAFFPPKAGEGCCAK